MEDILVRMGRLATNDREDAVRHSSAHWQCASRGVDVYDEAARRSTLVEEAAHDLVKITPCAVSYTHLRAHET